MRSRHPARSTGALVDAYWRPPRLGLSGRASRSRRCCGASCRARARPDGCRWSHFGWSCDRELEIGGLRGARVLVASMATLGRRRGDAFEARLVGADGKKMKRPDLGLPARMPIARRRRSRPPISRLGASRPNRRAQPHPALHHVDPAAGSQPQARLMPRPYDAGRAADFMKASISMARPPASLPICVPMACRSTARRSRRPAR